MIPDTLASIKALSAEKCTAIKAAPTIFMDIINHSELKKYPMPDLQTMLIGASTVPKDLLFQVKERLGVANVLIGYAQTESGCAGAFTNVTDVNRSEKAAYESIGRNFIELKIVDQETRQLVPVGVDGEICLRGYSIMKGYHEDPERTKSTIDENGWLKTGDVGYMDENGYIYFKARGKVIIWFFGKCVVNVPFFLQIDTILRLLFYTLSNPIKKIIFRISSTRSTMV